jgi:hypothetical protein
MKFEQAAIAVQNVPDYARFQALIEALFDVRNVEAFLSRVRRLKLRVRDFDGILGRELIGNGAAEVYAALPVSDQAQTRERYLQLVEAVPPALRRKYLKVYAYY